ncbi:hypothetical protein [uncultured Methanobrevibacter sp.]|uniref:hypothetical protein n=1 Tax=uncultured Methanobrevibacter sp. TaxID=253161 RepID=UPI0025E4D9AA|nr:hypothetical protein [uncultured Methanobrevibacter sp.]
MKSFHNSFASLRKRTINNGIVITIAAPNERPTNPSKAKNSPSTNTEDNILLLKIFFKSLNSLLTLLRRLFPYFRLECIFSKKLFKQDY